MDEFTKLGFYIGVTGLLLDGRRNKGLKAAVAKCPVDKIVVETDAPWMAYYGDGQKQSVPEHTGILVVEIAHQRKTDEILLGHHIYRNTLNLFPRLNTVLHHQ
jgi:TatD DNase family protein